MLPDISMTITKDFTSDASPRIENSTPSVTARGSGSGSISQSSVTEIRSVLGIAEDTIITILKGLNNYQVIEFNQTSGNIAIISNIDIF